MQPPSPGPAAQCAQQIPGLMDVGVLAMFRPSFAMMTDPSDHDTAGGNVRCNALHFVELC